jgi:hypothetical protein
VNRRKHQTIADLAAIALCPSLIVLLISSLVYFLTLCVYRGDYSGRIGYIWFMFIMGAVGIARLSIEQSRTYAMGYAAVLGLATFVVLSRFITIQGPLASTAPIFNGMVIALVWFLADRITFDCTLIDDDEDASGRGLLDGLTEEASAEKDEAQQRTRSRGHQPGRTVMWLTAAALPFFGLGQAMLPADDRWQTSAMLALGIYLFAALSLMVATSFLGVRRYLRQRGVDMPANVSAAWLVGGVMVTLLLLLVCFMLPQPGQMLATAELPETIESPDWLKPSKYGWGSETASNEGGQPDAATAPPQEDAESTEDGESSGDPNAAGKGKGGQGKPDEASSQGKSDQPSDSSEGAGSTSSDKGQSGEGEGKNADQSSGGSKRSDSGEKGKQGSSESAKDKSSSSDSKSEKSESGEGSEQGDGKSGQGDNAQKQGEGEKSKGEQSKGEQSNQEQSGSDGEKSENGKETEPGDAGEPKDESSPEKTPDESTETTEQPQENAETTPPETPESSSSIFDSLPSLTTLLRGLIYLVTIGILAAFIWVQREEIAKAWQAFLAWLRGEGIIASEQADAPASSVDAVELRPFSSFQNPLNKRIDPRDAIIVTYQAAEAWWREHGQPRKADETPHEFSRRLKPRDVNEHDALIRLTDAYNRVVYGDQSVQSPDLAAAADVWKSFAKR